MFYELIHTRCRNGVDILKKGAKISSDGYKVYSCSPEVISEGVVDLQFLAKEIEVKQSYNDPTFMDDAYLYYVPDNGKSFIVNFHPVPFDKELKEKYPALDWSHRPGNFVNQVFVGEFKEFYLFEIFGNETVWNAKAKGVPHYYHEEPTLNPYADINGRTPKISFEDIGKFIFEGRKEALAKAVAFIIEQYTKSPEDRQYLVIREENSSKIEMWIAAIQCAFSPKIASAVPFATRMDKFNNNNKYTIDKKTGMFQPQINLQDPNQTQRWRAMIIGVDERDRANVNAARSAPNLPFLLLDGKTKSIEYSVDDSQSYFKLITKFDDGHRKFCCDFLQSLNVVAPSDKVYNLCNIYNTLDDLSEANIKNITYALNELKRFDFSDTQYFRNIYDELYKNVSSYLQYDAESALSVIDWLISVNSNSRNALNEIVCNSFIHCLFNGKNSENYWRVINTKNLAQTVAPVVVDNATIEANKQTIQNQFNPLDVVLFFKIYNECLRITHKTNTDSYVLTLCLWVCYQHKEKIAFQELASYEASNLQETLFKIALNYKTEASAFSEYIMSSFLEMPNNEISNSNDAVKKFCNQLKLIDLKKLIPITVSKRLNNLRAMRDYEKFLILIEEQDIADNLSDDFLVEVFRTIDAKIKPTDMGALQLANSLLKKSKHDIAICENSANLCVLSLLHEWAVLLPNERTQWIKWAKDNKVPSINEADYIGVFVEHMTKINATNSEEHLTLVELLVSLPMPYIESYIGNIVKSALKYPNDKLYFVLYYLMEHPEYVFLRDTVVAHLIDYKPKDKAFAALSETMKDSKTKAYFKTIEDSVLEELAIKKSNSFFGKLFGEKNKNRKK